MKIEEQTRKLAAGCSKQCFELTSSVLSTTSKLYFEQPAASFLVCSLIFIEYKITFVAKSTGVIFFFYPMINVL